MMLKSVSFSPLVRGGKPYCTAIHNCHSLCGGQLSTSLASPQHYPSFYLNAATSKPSGCRSREFPPSLLQNSGRSNLTAFNPATCLGAHCNLNNVNGIAFRRSKAVVLSRLSEPVNGKSTFTRNVNFIHGKPNTSARLQAGSSSSSSPSSSSASGSTPKQLQAFRPWLLLGLCMFASAAAVAAGAGSFAPRVLISSSPFPAAAEALARRTAASSSSSRSESEASHGKKVYFDYHVTGEVMTQVTGRDADIGVPGDGRCLFRAVAHGACLRSGRAAPDESTQRQMADDLRSKALDELVRRRESSEWFIEGDFDAYVRRMRLPHTWGGEPELLMLSNVLQMPITVYMKDKGGIIAIAEYGQEHGTDKPIRVLYHGFGHYEALHLPEDTPMPSRL